MTKVTGTIVYRIERNGCLSGIYTTSDNGKSHQMYNEIARKKDKTEITDETAIPGDYICSWINVRNQVVIGELHIAKNAGKYHLAWSIDGEAKYEGTGYLTGEYQLSVTYNSID